MVSSGRSSWCRGRCQWGSRRWAVEDWGLGGSHGRSGVSVTSVATVHIVIGLLRLGRCYRLRRINVHVVMLSLEERCGGKGQGGACGNQRAALLLQTCGVCTHEGEEGLGLNGV